MPKIGRRRVTQGLINQMGELRRQGLPFHEIARKLGCSERTARRYAGHIRPSLELPPAVLEASPRDPGKLREELARWCADELYQSEEHPRPRESVTFLNEAMRRLRDRPGWNGPLVLEQVWHDIALRRRIIRETVGPLYRHFPLPCAVR